MNRGNFASQARKAERKVVMQASETIRAVALDAYSEIQAQTVDGSKGSPVASGRLASSTRLSLNTIDRSTAPEDPNYDYPSPEVHKYDAGNLPPRTIRNNPISSISAKLRNFRLGDTIFISNAVPYIRQIEVGGRSWQAPQGVFETTIRDVMARFKGARLRFRVR